MDITNFIRDGITYPIGDTKSRESIATAFDSTASYSAGDYAMYDGTLYKFTSSHSGDWNPSHAEATCVTDELGSGGGGNAQVMYYYQQPVNTATNAEIFRITSEKINTDTVVLECTFADPSYITSDVIWTSYEGYIAFTGTCTTATTANVTMAYKTENSISDRLFTLLWENPNPNSAFASQTISLDLSQYDMISVKSKMNVNVSENLNHYTVTNAFIDGKAYCAFTVGNLGNASVPNIFTRWFYPSVSSINFDVGCYKSATTTASASDNGNIMVPQAIYGISKYKTISNYNPKVVRLAWIASSNNSLGTQLTEKATLSIGKYLLICSMPAISTNTIVGIKPETDAITTDSFFYVANHNYDSFSKYFEVNSNNTEVYIGSAQSAGVTFTDISTRAGVTIIKL